METAVADSSGGRPPPWRVLQFMRLIPSPAPNCEQDKFLLKCATLFNSCIVTLTIDKIK